MKALLKFMQSTKLLLKRDVILMKALQWIRFMTNSKVVAHKNACQAIMRQNAVIKMKNHLVESINIK